MKKTAHSIRTFLFVFFLVFNVCEAQKVYEINRTLTISGGLNFLKDSDFGIKSNSDKQIFVKVYDKFLYESEILDKKEALIYAFKSTGNTGTAYQNTNYLIEQKFSLLCYLGFCPFKPQVQDGIYSTNSNSLKDFKARIVKRQYYDKNQTEDDPGFYKIGNQSIEVVVEVVLEEGTKLSNILGIKLPGLSPLVGSSFAPQTFAIIGNYGCESKQSAKDVATLIKNTIKPDVIISGGNDSYHNLAAGGCGTAYSSNTGVLYNNWVSQGLFRSVLGKMDYEDGSGNYLGTGGETQWKTYFGNTDVNYTVVYGNVEFFMINTVNRLGPDTKPTDGATLTATKTWLQNKLTSSQKQYKIVVGHHAPIASGQATSALASWNLREMGADMYISSGPNFYERHDVNGIPYVNVGVGGFALNATNYTAPSTMVKKTHLAAKYGALKAIVDEKQIRFQFLGTDGKMLDEFYIFGWEKAAPGNNYYLEKLRGTAVAASNEAIDVYLILGQSNASGRCGWLCFREFTGDYGGQLDKSYLLNENNLFEKAKNSFARYSTVEKYVNNSGMGVGWSFAKTLNTAYPTKKFGFISNARGGVETTQWFPGYVLQAGEDYGKTTIGYTPGNNLYKEAKARYKAMKLKYPNAVLKGVIWMQGESDAQKVNTMGYNYELETKKIIKAFREDTDYGQPNLPFLIPEMSYTTQTNDDWNHIKINEQLNKLKDVSNKIYVASANGLTTEWDNSNVHWDNPSYTELGKRLANLLIAANPVAKSSNSEVSANLTDVSNVPSYNNMRIYPNPSKDGIFTLEFALDKGGAAEIAIRNLSGMSVYNKKYANLEKGNQSIQFKNGDVTLPTGIYVVKLVTNEFTETRKLVID